MNEPGDRRARRPRGEQSEAPEPPALVEPIAEATGGPTVETTEAQVIEGKRRQRARKADTAAIELKVGPTAKVSARLPILTVWRLKHHMADRPDATEGQIIAPLLDAYLSGFDYPKRPEWLLQALKGENPTQETSAA